MFRFKKSQYQNVSKKPANPDSIKERASERINCKTPVVFENYDTGEAARGSAINYSKGGLYIETDYCPQEGTGALVHMTDYSPSASGPNGLQKYYVEVKWTKSMSGMKDHSRYGIGVEHCNDIYELFRLFGH